MPRTLPLALIAATLALGLNSAGAAPKHDKHDKHGGGGDDVTVDLRGPSIDIGRVRISAAQPLLLDAYADFRRTGAFILIDPDTKLPVKAQELFPDFEQTTPAE